MLVTNKQLKTFFLITISAALLFCIKAHGTVVPIEKGMPALSDGYLFEKSDWLKARTAVAQNIIYKGQLLNAVELLHIENNRVANRTQMIEELHGQNENNKFLQYFYFAGGVIVGGLVVDLVKH
jgi:hypothetical protein